MSELENGATVDVTDDVTVQAAADDAPVVDEAAVTSEPPAEESSTETAPDVTLETAAEAATETDDETTAADGEESGEPETDPREEFRDHLLSLPGDWYVVHSYAGYENRVKHNLENRRASLSMEDFVHDVEVPQEEVVEIKNGQRKQVKRNKFPGYVLVRMDLTDESWSRCATRLVSPASSGTPTNPTPLTLDEVISILLRRARGRGRKAVGWPARRRPRRPFVDFEVGESVTVIDGAFATLPGHDQRDQRRRSRS